MKKALKITGKILLWILILIIAFLAVMFVIHRIMLKTEEPLLQTPGQLVEVDGHNMNVYTEGEGEHTIVFLSGSGTAAPVYDFKTLAGRLTDEYRIVVVEKYGYGFSDVVDTERSFDTILRQDREALAKAGIEAPYVLCPHSLSGIEALMWAQEYPDEVEAIVGLDMALPRHYDELDLRSAEKIEKIAAVARKMGLARLFYTDKSLPGELSAEDKKVYKAIAAKIAVNIDVINEGNGIPDACKKIDSRPAPDIPTLMFISNGTETDCANWITAQRDYAAGLTDAKVIEFDCGHYVHNHEPDRIAAEMKTFINAH